MRLSLTLSLLTLVLASCASSGSSGADAEEVTLTQDVESYLQRAGKLLDQEPTGRGFPLSASIWPSPEIKIGWENPAPENARFRGWVQEGIMGAWPVHSGLKLTWVEKADETTNIRILMGNGWPHTKGLGRMLDKKKNGMELIVDFHDNDLWKPFGPKGSRRCPVAGMSFEEFVAKSVSIHEMGHALGLAHEHQRDDAPEAHKKCAQGTSGDFLIGAYDLQSVMNYMNPKPGNFGQLSPGDRAAIAFMYPKFPALTPPAEGVWSGSGTARDGDREISIDVTVTLRPGKGSLKGDAKVAYTSAAPSGEKIERAATFPLEGFKVNSVNVMYRVNGQVSFVATDQGFAAKKDRSLILTAQGAASLNGEAVQDKAVFEQAVADFEIKKYMPDKIFSNYQPDKKGWNAEVPLGSKTWRVLLTRS